MSFQEHVRFCSRFYLEVQHTFFFIPVNYLSVLKIRCWNILFHAYFFKSIWDSSRQIKSFCCGELALHKKVEKSHIALHIKFLDIRYKDELPAWHWSWSRLNEVEELHRSAIVMREMKLGIVAITGKFFTRWTRLWPSCICEIRECFLCSAHRLLGTDFIPLCD